jgi:hypothetical protein
MYLMLQRQLINLEGHKVYHRQLYNKPLKVKVTLRLTISQPVSKSMGLMTRYFLLFDSYGLVFLGRPLWREDGSVFCICWWSSPAQSFLGQSPLGLVTIIYCLRFEAYLFVASYDSQGHGGAIRTRLHTGVTNYWTCSPRYITPARAHRERLLHYCAFCFRGNVSTDLFPSNGCCTVACLHNCYLAMGLHVTIATW